MTSTRTSASMAAIVSCSGPISTRSFRFSERVNSDTPSTLAISVVPSVYQSQSKRKRYDHQSFLPECDRSCPVTKCLCPSFVVYRIRLPCIHAKALTYNPVAHEHTHDFLLIYDKEPTRLEVSMCVLLLGVCKAVSLMPRVSFLVKGQKPFRWREHGRWGCEGRLTGRGRARGLKSETCCRGGMGLCCCGSLTLFRLRKRQRQKQPARRGQGVRERVSEENQKPKMILLLLSMSVIPRHAVIKFDCLATEHIQRTPVRQVNLAARQSVNKLQITQCIRTSGVCRRNSRPIAQCYYPHHEDYISMCHWIWPT